MTGKVYLVGAGPGDRKLLTLRAAELLSTADLVVIDALVSPEIRSMIPRSATVVEAGKRAGAHTMPQEEISRLLVREARAGKRVVRLKGGDPFVFGRGGEEAEELQKEGIAFEIVPGISSAIAGPAYAGIPVTHRSFSTSFTLVTGHESEETTGVRWDLLAQLEGTVVFLMGLSNLRMIVEKLTSYGRPASTPAAVISQATTPRQRSVAGTLADIERLATGRGLEPPAIVVVGEVVRLHDTLGWFERRPLFGKRIVVTRAREQASELRAFLEDAGAEVLEFPTIEIHPPSSFESLDRVIATLVKPEGRPYHWMMFTSSNGVRSFFERLSGAGRDARSLAAAKIAAVGASTSELLRSYGIAADLVPERFVSTELLPLLPLDQRGIRTAVIRAAEGRDDLIAELRRRGGEVDVAVAYETRPGSASADEIRQRIAEGSIDLVTFTSSSTVTNFFARLTAENKQALLSRAVLASIGPVTSEAIRAIGAEAGIEAPDATVAALRDAIVDWAST